MKKVCVLLTRLLVKDRGPRLPVREETSRGARSDGSPHEPKTVQQNLCALGDLCG
jgi:hypothetical protein